MCSNAKKEKKNSKKRLGVYRDHSEIRECHGFTNLSRVTGTGYQGTGWGWQIPTLEKPAPGTRVYKPVAGCMGRVNGCAMMDFFFL